MRRLLLVLCLCLGPSPAVADADLLGTGVRAAGSGDIGLAREAQNALDDQIARDLIEWTLLRRGGSPFEDYERFLSRNPDWPGLDFLRARGEPSIPRGGAAARVMAYFEDQPPQTGLGALALANALRAEGEDDAARDVVIRAWTGLVMSGDEAAALRSANASLLDEGDLHVRRLDHLLWEGAEDRARAMFPFVPEDWHPLAEARLALRNRVPGVDAAIERVPEALQDDPGLAYERFIWRIGAGFWESAGDLLAERSTSAEALGRPLAWADRRADLARDVMREGEFGTCHDYAANHFITPEADGSAFAELEWIAGYCAFRQGRFETAAGHFEAFRDTVASPISVGRAGYWLGRAHEALGNAAEAAEAYGLGARNQSSFYGQLAAERGGLPVDPTFIGDEDFGDWRQASFTSSTVFHAALLLYEAGESQLAERFLTHLTESLSRREAGLLGDFALELGDGHLALRIAKRAAQNGHEIMRAYYPVTDLARGDWPVDAALALSIARRESEFDPRVVSPAGAMGLMQVMPGTGRDTAAALDIAYESDRVLSDPDYNALLGTAYIADLNARFDGNIVLVSAGYNAGPGRALEWIARFGDPRDEDADGILYWIEAIPFSETRNYIMRVTESIPIYEAQLTGELPATGMTERLLR
jgi:soluble lytic murein transglycosylase